MQAARLAAGRRTDADIAVLRACLAERERVGGEDASFVEADLAFHRGVVAAAHNPLLAEMFDSFAAVLREALIAIRSDRDLGATGADAAHQRLAAAIEAGDAAAAAQATPLFGLLADSRGLGVTLAVLAGLPVVSLALAARLREPRPAGAMTTTRGKPVSSAGR